MDLEKIVFLVIDDIDAMRRVISNQLRSLGASQIITAANGAEGLRILRRQKVDVVLSDWNMPVMTGLELLKTMRADEQLCRVPLVMITAEAERARVEVAIANGVSSLLVKPYKSSSLADRIEKALKWQPRQINLSQQPATSAAEGGLLSEKAIPAATTSMDVASSDKPTILVVDDTPDNLQLLAELFMDDYRVRVADNGARALEICASDTPPDLVLLDVMMPGMDGFEVARRLREHPNTESTPVIFVTALTSTDAHMKGMELGAVDFVTKPIDPDMLKPRVKNFMRYVALHKQLQAEYDSMLTLAQLRADVEMITRHDVKAPLAGIMALVQPMIEGEELTPRNIEVLRLIEEMALQALDVVNLTTELYKIETGAFVLQALPVKIGDVLRRVVEITRATFAVRGLQLNLLVETGDIEGLLSLGDGLFCYSIFQNLLKNACESSPDSGRISIHLRQTDQVLISIQNSGAVPLAIRDRFFEKFVTMGKVGGTGIGTYSAKLLTEAQGGQISMLTSDSDDSTVITVALPAYGK